MKLNANESHFKITRPADFNHLVTLDSSYSVKVRYNYTGNDTYQVSNEKFNVFSLPDGSKVNLMPGNANVTTQYFNPSMLTNYSINNYSFNASYHHFMYDEDNDLLRLSCMPGTDNFACIIYTLDFATTRVDFELAIKDENQGLDIGEYEIVLYDYDVNNNLEVIGKVVGTDVLDTSLPSKFTYYEYSSSVLTYMYSDFVYFLIITKGFVLCNVENCLFDYFPLLFIKII